MTLLAIPLVPVLLVLFAWAMNTFHDHRPEAMPRMQAFTPPSVWLDITPPTEKETAEPDTGLPQLDSGEHAKP